MLTAESFGKLDALWSLAALVSLTDTETAEQGLSGMKWMISVDR